MERSLVLVKPDGVLRGLTGVVISRIEQAGLKVIGLKLVVPDKKLAERHYPWDPKWAQQIWDRTKKAMDAKGEKMPAKDATEYGQFIRSTLMNYIVGRPVVAIVVEGNDAIASIRKICGATSPHLAEPGSIRGMYSTDSYDLANLQKRSVVNIMHASDSVTTADKEIPVWFTEKELVKYKRADEDTIYKFA
ncbi:MAG: nucleoside-diphosphate kinase [Candidatus Marsarchaeota archaeon]|nr:nucleoside-diphosphate kinase [Candidatus Marsarchaeota archaeon]